MNDDLNKQKEAAKSLNLTNEIIISWLATWLKIGTPFCPAY